MTFDVVIDQYWGYILNTGLAMNMNLSKPNTIRKRVTGRTEIARVESQVFIAHA